MSTEVTTLPAGAPRVPPSRDSLAASYQRAVRDPRLNAPSRLSDLHGDARTRVLAARAQASAAEFRGRYRNSRRVGLIERILSALVGAPTAR